MNGLFHIIDESLIMRTPEHEEIDETILNTIIQFKTQKLVNNT